MKSAYQILKEYKNHQKNPQYAWIVTNNNLHNESTHADVSNIEDTRSEGVNWLEFDCVVNQKKIHCKIRAGYVSEYHEYIRE